MKKPEEKISFTSDIEHDFKKGYNQACEDWNKFLPDSEEIEDILDNLYRQGKININFNTIQIISGKIAKVIGKE